MADFSAADVRHMSHAVRLSRRALGDTAENPPVGCVIVNDGMPVGVGWTCCGGRPHAETMALQMAGEKARGATAYVTLEPCAHHGRTPPCAEALAEAGIGRVVAAVKDPDARVCGRGLAMLNDAGARVEVGLLAGEARRVLAGFLSRVERGRPWVLLKLALSADGKIAARPGEATAITGERARARAHVMRAQADAILVGVDTVIADDPMLTCRLPGLEGRSPLRVVLDSRMRIDEGARLLNTPRDAPTWIFTTVAGRERALAMQGRHPHVRIIPVEHDAAGRVRLAAVMEKLAGEGVNRLMVEGGARVARAFVEASLVDEAAIFTAPGVRLGEQGVDALAGLDMDALTGAAFRMVEETALGPDMLRVYERADDDNGNSGESGGS